MPLKNVNTLGAHIKKNTGLATKMCAPVSEFLFQMVFYTDLVMWISCMAMNYNRRIEFLKYIQSLTCKCTYL